MKFNQHLDLEGKHAFLSASKYHWINYTDDKLEQSYTSYLAKEKGTVLHEFAATCITLGQKLPRSGKTLNRYVNDAIGFKMQPEVLLYYSDNCFGTADAISFRNKVLKIHDLKTGVTATHMEQLELYSALFCLEYHVAPSDISIELSIYQLDDVEIYIPESERIRSLMDKIISSDKHMEIIKAGGKFNV